MAIVLYGIPLERIELPADVAAAVASGDGERIMALRLEYDTFEQLQILNLVRVLLDTAKRLDAACERLDKIIKDARTALEVKR